MFLHITLFAFSPDLIQPCYVIFVIKIINKSLCPLTELIMQLFIRALGGAEAQCIAHHQRGRPETTRELVAVCIRGGLYASTENR